MDVRERVLGALQELARTRGLAAVTMDELAQRAGLSKRTIYRYFPGKEQVVEAMVEHMMREVATRRERILAGPERPREKLRLFIAGVHEAAKFLNSPTLADIPKHYPALFATVDAFRSAQIMALEGLFAEGAACGDFRRLDPAVAAAALLGLVKSIINPDFILGHSLSGTEAFGLVFDIFLNGVAGPEAEG